MNDDNITPKMIIDANIGDMVIVPDLRVNYSQPARRALCVILDIRVTGKIYQDGNEVMVTLLDDMGHISEIQLAAFDMLLYCNDVMIRPDAIDAAVAPIVVP